MRESASLIAPPCDRFEAITTNAEKRPQVGFAPLLEAISVVVVFSILFAGQRYDFGGQIFETKLFMQSLAVE